MIKVITFDLDDTLWDVRPALVAAERAQNDYLETHFPGVLKDHSDDSLMALKRSVLASDPALKHNISVFRQTFLQQLLLQAGIAEEEANSGSQEAFAAFLGKRNAVALYPTAEPMLRALADRYTLGTLTNGNADVWQTPIGKYFSFAFRAEEVGAAKPEPNLFLKALEHTGRTPDQLLHVGDSHEHDVQGARRVGARAIWFAPSGEDNRSADHVIRCLSELPALLN